MPASKYETHVLPRLEEIKAWARDGLTSKDIAHNLGIAECTIIEYRKKHPELAEAVAHGRAYVDDVVVVNAYLRRVTGYDAIEYKREYKITHDENGKEIRELVRVTEQSRHIPPDPRAGEFWLTNRQPEKWKYPQRVMLNAEEDADESGVVLIPAAASESECTDDKQ